MTYLPAKTTYTTKPMVATASPASPMVFPTLKCRTSSKRTSREAIPTGEYLGPRSFSVTPTIESFLIVGSLTVTASPFVSVTRTDEGRSSAINCCGLTVVGRQV